MKKQKQAVIDSFFDRHQLASCLYCFWRNEFGFDDNKEENLAGVLGLTAV